MLASGFGIYRVKWEPWFTRNVKLGYRQWIHFVLGCTFVRTLLKLFQTLSDVECQINKQSVCFTFDFICSEENICFEIVQRLIQDIGISSFFWSWPPKLSFQWQYSHIPNSLGRVQKLGMISLLKWKPFLNKLELSKSFKFQIEF